jgi:hypothetical protein
METTTGEILLVIGLLLLFFSGLCGLSLFVRVVVGSKEKSDGSGIGTLWGLFPIALAVGIILIMVTG